MVIGVLGAAAQYEFRKIFCRFILFRRFGYMIMGIALFTPMALLGTVFSFVVNQILRENETFSSYPASPTGWEDRFELKELGGLYKNYLWLGCTIPDFRLLPGWISTAFGLLGKNSPWSMPVWRYRPGSL